MRGCTFFFNVTGLLVELTVHRTIQKKNINTCHYGRNRFHFRDVWAIPPLKFDFRKSGNEMKMSRYFRSAP